jgi:hypothetical protein
MGLGIRRSVPEGGRRLIPRLDQATCLAFLQHDAGGGWVEVTLTSIEVGNWATRCGSWWERTHNMGGWVGSFAG